MKANFNIFHNKIGQNKRVVCNSLVTLPLFNFMLLSKNSLRQIPDFKIKRRITMNTYIRLFTASLLVLFSFVAIGIGTKNRRSKRRVCQYVPNFLS